LLEENLGSTTNVDDPSSSMVLDPTSPVTGIAKTTSGSEGTLPGHGGSDVTIPVNRTPAVDVVNSDATEVTDMNKKSIENDAAPKPFTGAPLAPIAHSLSADENGLPLEGNLGRKYSLFILNISIIADDR
jgi:hypothetical protein